MISIINSFQQTFYKTVSSDGIQDFIEVFTIRPGCIFYITLDI